MCQKNSCNQKLGNNAFIVLVLFILLAIILGAVIY